MANWNSPYPKQNWSDLERVKFLQEIWTRLKFFPITIPVGVFVAPPAGIVSIFVTVVGGGGAIETDFVDSLRQGMPIKLTYTPSGTSPPPAGLTWDCSVQADRTLDIWFNNSTAAPIPIQDGEWQVMGVIP